MKNSRDLRIYLLISAVILIAIVGFRFMDTRPVKFNSDAWKRAKGITGLRYRMRDDLFSRIEGTQISYGDVLDMLGEPDRTNIVDPNNVQPHAYMVYQLGLEDSFIPFEHFYLRIDFDSNGFVNNTSVYPQ